MAAHENLGFIRRLSGGTATIFAEGPTLNHNASASATLDEIQAEIFLGPARDFAFVANI